MLDFESKDSKLAGSLSKKSLDFSDNLAEEKVKTFSPGSNPVFDEIYFISLSTIFKL
jgi:hypothetical protein